MVKLQAKSPADGVLAARDVNNGVSEIALGRVTSIAPFQGKEEQVDKALGVALPKVGRSVMNGGQELVWLSQGQYLAIGADLEVDLAGHAALSDQSDAWCALEMKGANSEAILARLVPVDLRASVFKKGHCLRSQLGHLPLHITRLGSDRFRVMSFRSMAGSMVHEITQASELLAARG